jgi:chitodextrinase
MTSTLNLFIHFFINNAYATPPIFDSNVPFSRVLPAWSSRTNHWAALPFTSIKLNTFFMHQLLKLLSGKLRTTAVLSFFCLTTLLSGNAFATDWYVSATNGNDQNNTGKSTSSPYRTIQKAADNAVSGDVVYVRAGTYREQVDIKSNGVTFQPYSGETVTINGTDLLTAWTLESGSTYKTTMNWNVDATWGTNQLFQDGTMIEWARWPDQTSADIVAPTNAKAEAVSASDASENYFTITDNEFNEPAGRWDGAQIWVNLSMGGLDGQGWTGKVVSTSGNTITVDFGSKPKLGNEAWHVGAGTEYFLFDPVPAKVTATGGVDALLSPGEWWKDGNTLYVKTRNGSAPNASGTGTNVIEAKKRHFAFWSSTNRSGYTIKDFNLFASSITTDKDAKTNRTILENVQNITLDGLKVKYVSHQTVMSGNWQAEHQGWTGIVLSGRNNTIQNCDIQYSSTTALTIQGYGNKVLNNRIHDTNYMVSNSGALNTGWISEDSEIGYNRIWNTTMIAIHFKGLKNTNPAVKGVARIHHNEIFDYMRRGGDSGAIDMVGQDLQWVRIDHNYIYNTLGHDETGDASLMHGIYLDFGGEGRKIRAIVDHNVVTNAFTPMLLNDGTEVEVYNNVFIGNNRTDVSSNARYSIGNYNDEHQMAGRGVTIFNNILSHPPNVVDALRNATYLKNIDNAKPGSALLASLFVNPVLTGTNRSIENFRLKDNETTRSLAIDKGISVAPWDDNVQGPPDLGAFEWGTLLSSPDTQAPSVPQVSSFSASKITTTSFSVTWTASTDNVGVVYYEVYSNGKLLERTDTNSVDLINLTPSTSYFITVLAVDGTGNRSALSEKFEVKTILNDLFLTKTSVAPVIDGTKEATWTSSMLPIAKVLSTAPSSAADASGSWTSLWDNENLYIFVDVNDNEYKVDSDGNWWEDDHLEIYIDAAGTRPTSYGDYQYQYFIRRGGTALAGQSWYPARATANIVTSNVEKPGGAGYRLEVKIPFASLGVTAEEYKFMGIDVQIGDDDDGGKEDTRLGWHSAINAVYSNPSLMAVVQLKGTGAVDATSPTTPTNLQATGFTATGFTLSWTASTDSGSGVGGYEVFQNGNLLSTSYTNSISFTDLDPATASTITVRAKDRVGNLSPMSSVLKVTTPAANSELVLQAEDATLGGYAVVSTQDTGYTGTGYVGGYWQGTSSTTFTINNVPEAGEYLVRARYAAGWGDAPISVYVNGVKITSLTFNNTAAWNVWLSKTLLVTLQAGTNTIMYRNDPDDRMITLDYIALFINPGADSKAPSAPTNLAASAITNSGFTLSWNAATDNSGSIAGYEIFRDNVSVGTTTTATTFNVGSLSPGTTYQMTVKAKDAQGSESDPSAAKSVTTTTAASTLRDADNPASTVAGLDYKYYEGTWSVLPNFDGLTAVKQGNVTNFDISPRNRNDNFGFKFSGFVNVPSDGTYTFYTSSDDGSKLYIGTTEVVNNDGLHGNQERSGTIGLKAGKHAITVIFFENGGGESLSVSYSGPNLSKTTIPASALYRAGTATGSVTMEMWTGVSGRAVSNIPVNSTTNKTTSTLTSLESTASGDNYGVRIRGYIVPSTTADYYFYIASDDNGEFWLSSDDQPSNKGTAPIAKVTDWTNSREWQKSGLAANQKSAVKRLQAGSRYYFEALMKEEGGGDNLAIGWTTATNNTGITVIGSSNIAPYSCTNCRTESTETAGESLSLQLYPNPANEEVTISLSGFEAESSVEVKMSDMNGRSFLHRQVQPRLEGKQVTLSVRELPQGLFFVTVQGNKVGKTAKLVITK